MSDYICFGAVMAKRYRPLFSTCIVDCTSVSLAVLSSFWAFSTGCLW